MPSQPQHIARHYSPVTATRLGLRANGAQQVVVDVANEADCEMERGDISPFCVAHALAKADQTMIDGVWHFEGDEKTMHRLYGMPKSPQIDVLKQFQLLKNSRFGLI